MRGLRDEDGELLLLEPDELPVLDAEQNVAPSASLPISADSSEEAQLTVKLSAISSSRVKAITAIATKILSRLIKVDLPRFPGLS